MQMKNMTTFDGEWLTNKRIIRGIHHTWIVSVNSNPDSISLDFRDFPPARWILPIKKSAGVTVNNIFDTLELYFKSDIQACNLEELLKQTGMIE